MARPTMEQKTERVIFRATPQFIKKLRQEAYDRRLTVTRVIEIAVNQLAAEKRKAA